LLDWDRSLDNIPVVGRGMSMGLEDNMEEEDSTSVDRMEVRPPTPFSCSKEAGNMVEE